MSGLHDVAARALTVLEPEIAHRLTIRLLKMGLGPRVAPSPPSLATEVAGLRLPCCIGLAAGFDKNAEVPAAMLAAGFGFVECGAVTPKPQAGNPRPRLFRLTEDKGVINRMGFNNAGLDAFAGRLAGPRRGIVGVNVGANKDSADRVGDYALCLERLWRLADYFALNVSSPNTPGLRGLQTRESLAELLERIAPLRARLSAEHGERALFVKVAPDLDDEQIAAIAEAAVTASIDGLIVGNTTLSRPPELVSRFRGEGGGLSGAPLMPLSTAVLRRFHQVAQGRLALIGAGGVSSGADAYAKIRAGASAVQLYSALVFQGPGVIGRIARDLADRLAADGFGSVAEAVGA